MIHGLDHVAIVVTDLEAAVQDYAALLGRTAEREGEAGGAERAWFHLENTSAELIAANGPGPAGDRVRARLETAGEGLWAIAFATADLASARHTLERRGVPCAVAESGGSLIADLGASHGVQIVIRQRGAAERPAPSQLMGDPAAAFAGLDHVVVYSPNPERAAALYGARLGLDLRLDRSNPDWGARQLFFRCGDLVIEIAHGLKTGVSDGPDSLGGLAWRAANPEAVRARLADAGFNVSEVRKGRKPGTQVFTVRDRTCGVPTLALSASARPET